jgi:polyisoprenoid-binding protein YceI
MNYRNAAIIVTYCIGSICCLPARGQNPQAPTPKALATVLTSASYGVNHKTITTLQTGPPKLSNTAASAENEPEAMTSRYTVDYGASYLIAITGKSGLLSFAGHNHAVIATKWSAVVDMTPTDVAHSSVTISVETAGLVIDSSDARQRAGLGAGPGPGEIPTIQKRMLSQEVLDARRYPVISFTSATVEAEGSDHLRVSGEFELHGHRRRVVVPARYRIEGDRMVLGSHFVIRQADYGLTPESVAGGTVKVKDEVVVRIHLELVRIGPPA